MPLPPHAPHNVDAVVLTIGSHGHVSGRGIRRPTASRRECCGVSSFEKSPPPHAIPPAEATGTELADNDAIRLSCSSCEGRLQDLRGKGPRPGAVELHDRVVVVGRGKMRHARRKRDEATWREGLGFAVIGRFSHAQTERTRDHGEDLRLGMGVRSDLVALREF